MKPNLHKIREWLKDNWLHIILIVIIFLLLFWLRAEKEKKDNLSNYIKQQSQQVEIYKNKLDGFTARVNALQFTERQLKDLILQKNDSLKLLADSFHKIEYITQIKEVVRVDSVYTPFEFDIDCEFERKGKFTSDKWFSFDYVANEKGFLLSDINIPNETTIITGTQRKWFLGNQTLHTELTNTNPYIQTTEMQTIIVPIEKKWYENQFLWLGAGFLGGVLIAK